MASDATANLLNNLKNNVYPGRGIVIGVDETNTNIIQVYWIMGRSENSRNRIFEKTSDGIRTRAFDESKVKDPSLIIYNVMRTSGTNHIVTNGDQTDTICEHLDNNTTFETALATRTFEPDAPNYTPRISGITTYQAQASTFKLNILLSKNNNADTRLTHTWDYPQTTPGIGHCIHTYQHDGTPLPSFAGAPYTVPLIGSSQEIAQTFWDTLNAENRISLAVKTISIAHGTSTTLLINKHH